MSIHDNEFFKVMGAHRQELASRFHVDSLSVFGSMARGDAVLDSDLDILDRVYISASSAESVGKTD